MSTDNTITFFERSNYEGAAKFPAYLASIEIAPENIEAAKKEMPFEQNGLKIETLFDESGTFLRQKATVPEQRGECVVYYDVCKI